MKIFNTKYKIGDKVKVIKFPERSCIGLICEVIEVPEYSTSYICRIKEISTHWNCLMYPCEIEPVAKAGQQLLFSFMDEVRQ